MSESIGNALMSAGSNMPSFLGGPTGTLGGWASGAGNWFNPATSFSGDPNAFGSNLPSIPSLNIGGDQVGQIGAPSNPFMSTVPPPAPLVPPSDIAAAGPAGYGPTVSDGTPMSAPGSTPTGAAPPPDGSSSGRLMAPPSSPYVPTPAPAPGAPGAGGVGSGGFGSNITNPPPLVSPASISGIGTNPGQSTWSQILFGTPANPGVAGSKATPGIIGGISGGIVDLLKYLQQRSIMDPDKLAAMQRKLMANQAAQLRKGIYPGVTAELQETGNINSPYLASQAYTAAIGPTLAEMQTQTLKDELMAQALAAGMWPDTEGALGGFANVSNLFG